MSTKGARKSARRGQLLVNGEPSRGGRRLQVGDVVERVPGTAASIYQREIEVLYDDTDVTVVRKPAGLLVSGNRLRTLQNALPHVLGTDRMARPVHRLDYETTGPVLIARSHEVLVALSSAFEHRRIHKRYLAIVQGSLEGEGRIDEPVEGRVASSRYRSLDVFPNRKCGHCSLIELEPVTGRTHQLRRHLQFIGHSIVGDGKYPTGPVYRGQGLFLAATELGFSHPQTGEDVVVRVDSPRKFTSYRERQARRLL